MGAADTGAAEIGLGVIGVTVGGKEEGAEVFGATERDTVAVGDADGGGIARGGRVSSRVALDGADEILGAKEIVGYIVGDAVEQTGMAVVPTTRIWQSRLGGR